MRRICHLTRGDNVYLFSELFGHVTGRRNRIRHTPGASSSVHRTWHLHHLLCVTIVLGTASMGQAWGQNGGPNALTERVINAGLDRTPWTESKLTGSPEPPAPYRLENAFPNLKFSRPVVLSSAPGTDRLFVVEVEGKVFSFPNDSECKKPDLFIDLRSHIPGVRQAYGLAFHPQFATNRYIYLCYVLKNDDPHGTHVSRFTVLPGEPPRVDPESEKVLITWYSGGHNGGCLKFGPDGCLYIATGDGTAPSPPDGFDTGQDTSDLLSSILRIDVDSKESEGLAYRVPDDNPFVKTAGTRDEIWAYGFRNPWKMSFDRATGDLWAGDVGWELWEMVYHVERGGNYGWSVMEGRQPVRPESRRGPTPILPPVVDHPHSEAASITGGFVYRGKSLPDLVGAYIYGDYVTGKIWALRYDGRQVTWHEELTPSTLQIIGFGEDSAGELYVMDYDRTGDIHRLVPNPDRGRPSSFPRKLSETGLYRDVNRLEPAPGVMAYDINAPLWSDHANGERVIGLPAGRPIEINRNGEWKFPNGTVFAKTMSIEMTRGDTATSRRIETQVLQFEENTWRAYSYRWNDEQSDAELVDLAGADILLSIVDAKAPQGRRQQTWRFAGRTECTLCHNTWAGSVLGFNPAQLNRQLGRGEPIDDHSSVNQLAMLEKMGLFSGTLRTKNDKLPKLSDPYDTSAELSSRARAYLDVNCAHCHRNGGGGTATIQLMRDVPLEKTGLIDTRATQGAFGISDARIVVPGDPLGSVLYYRLAKLGSGRMPRMGATIVDERALELIHDWIAGLGSEPTNQPISAEFVHLDEPAQQEAIGKMASSTRGALALERLIATGNLSDVVRERILAHTARHPEIAVRDLFERFLPANQRTKRLGSVVQTGELLAIAGNAARGEQLFFDKTRTQCASCHRVGDRGEKLGPELDQIAKTYDRRGLLETILQPSKKIAPEYVSYLLETTGGRLVVGLLQSKSDEEVTLKTAQNELVRVKAADIEQLVPQSTSIMPELLLRDLTAPQVADLIEFLSRQK